MIVYVFFLSFSSNFDDHDYENYDPKEHRIPGRGQSAANQPPPSSTTDTSTQQMKLSDSPNIRAGQVDSSTITAASSVSPRNDSSQVRASSTVSQPTTTSPLLQGNGEAQEPLKSPNLITQSPEASQPKKGTGPAPPPPVRKCSSLTRSNQSSSSSLQESPQLDDHSRKISLPSSLHLEPRSNNTVQRSKSIKLQAAKLQDLLSGRSTQNQTDDEDETTLSIRSAAALARKEAQKNNTGSSSPSSRKFTKPSMVIPPVPASKPMGVPQPHEVIRGVVATSQVRSGDVSPSLSQGSIDDDLKSRLDQNLLRKTLGTEVVSRAVASGVGESKTDTGEEEDSDAKEYKPRLHMIKARVEKRRQEVAQAQAVQALVNRTNSKDASDTSSNSTFIPGVNRPGDVNPIVIPPLVPPKPHPGHPSGDNGLENNSSPIPPPLETGGFMDSGIDEEEPPPLPARTPAMFELEKSSPKKTRKANYTNVSVESDQKESVSAPPPPPPDAGKKGASKKKGTNYPRVLLKKLKPEKKDVKGETPKPSTSNTKGKDTSPPTESPSRNINRSPIRMEQPILRSRSENGPSRLRPSSGPAIHVRPPMFVNMRERPLPQIPGGEIGSAEEPDHTAEDYEQFDLGQGMPLYANDPSHNYEEMEHKSPVPLPGRTIAASVQRAHSFNPGDRYRLPDPMARLPNPGRPRLGRSNFDPLPTPPPSQRSTDSDYVDGYVNTELPMQLPTRGGQLPEVPSGMRAQQKPSDIDHSDYDYPDLRQHGFLAHTLPSRRKTTSPLAQPGITSRQWGSDGYPQVQRWPNQAPSEPEEDEMRDRLDSDYVPMSSAAFTMDDSYINWETIKDICTDAGISDQGQQLLQQRVVPPRVGGPAGAHPLPGYAMDDMYMNVPHGTSSTNIAPPQEELARIRQQFQGFVPKPAPSRQLATPPIIQPVTSAETSSAGRGALGAPPSPRPKPKARQRSATTAAALEDTLPLASVAPGSPHPPTPEQAWHLPPVIQPLVSQQAGQPGMDPSIYQNVDPSSSLPRSFGQHVREGVERRSSESNMLAVKPTAAALPPRNIPRRPQH